MIKYGFTGTSKGMNKIQYNNIKSLLQKDLSNNLQIEVHHGDCIGADTDFHNICRELSDNIKIIIHPPSNDKKRSFCKSDDIRPEKEYLTRNKDIVNETNILIACPESAVEQLRSGTWSTVRYARKVNKIVILY